MWKNVSIIVFRFCLLLIMIISYLHMTHANVNGAEFDDQFYNLDIEKIKENLKRSEIVIVGTVKNIGDAPGVKSGGELAGQPVTYNVIRVLKGEYNKSEITIYHKVSQNTRNAVSDGSRLSNEVFSVAKKLIVMCRFLGINYWDIDSNLGTIPGSDKNINTIKLILK